MAKKNVWKTLAGLAVVGAAVGGAIAYVKKCKDVNDLSEEDFDDLMDDDEEETCAGCQTERTYTTLHAESDTVKPEETPVAEGETDTEETDEEATPATEETNETAGEETVTE